MTSRASSSTGRAIGCLLFGCVIAAGAARAQVPQLFGELHQIFPVEDLRALALAAGDVDVDGDVDLVLGYFVGQSRLYVNTGSGTFADETAARLPAAAFNTRAVVLGDVDGDGDVDLLIGNGLECSTIGGDERQYRNDGTGHFTDVTSSHLPAASDPTADVDLGDLDGDGDLDLVEAGGSAKVCGTSIVFPQPNRVFFNDGMGHYATSSALPATAYHTQAIAIGDVDGDLDLDLVMGNANQTSRLYTNAGSATFVDVTATHMPALTGAVLSLALGDVDADGDRDLVVGIGAGSNLLLLNDGAGHFADASATHLPPDVPGEMAHALALDDVDRDGDADLVLGLMLEQTSARNRLFANDGSGHFADVTAAHLPAVEDSTRSVLLTDVNGDGDPDLVVGNFDEQSFLHRNDGAGHFVQLASPQLVGGAVTWFGDTVAADLDGDGDQDVAASGAQGGVLFENDGTGCFEDVTAAQLPATGPFVTRMACADVDGDGDSDLTIGHWFGPVQLFVNDGTAHFAIAAPTPNPSDLEATRSIAPGDVDGDGDVDLVVGKGGYSFGGAQSLLFANDGTGHFADVTPGSMPALSIETEAVGLADVDGDADLDLVVADAIDPGDPNHLLLNDGAGHFADVTASQFPDMHVPTFALALGDVDGDGDTDVVTGSKSPLWGAAQNHLYANDGAGFFVDVTGSQLPSLPGATTGLALGDVDGDGDEDLAVGNEAYPNWLWTNDGTGHFADATAPHFPGPVQDTNDVELADLDGDGDRDVLLAGGNGIRLATNLRTQLAWRDPPAVRAPLTMDLYGVPGAPWTLAVAAGAASIPLPPFGTLALDPLSIQIVKLGLIGALGTGSASFVVPGDPSLLGASLDWQAALGVPIQLTNRERTTFGLL